MYIGERRGDEADDKEKKKKRKKGTLTLLVGFLSLCF